LIASTVGLVASLRAWGFKAHQEINYRAVSALPLEMQPFFLKYRDYLAEHAIDPDLWRQKDKSEGVNHYIDIDMYGRYPFRELPRDYQAAVAKFGEGVVRERGVAPWRVVEFLEKLTQAMREGNRGDILQTAAALGHYIADLHVPLHTVENYDGQLTDNKGIHKRWESVMIDAFLPEMQLNPAPAEYVEQPLDAIFDVVLDSYVFADDVLRADDHARVAGRKYEKPKDYGVRYYASLYRWTQWIATQRLESAINAVASFWYTAWRNAGQPTLPID
jgi:hypothetical protein